MLNACARWKPQQWKHAAGWKKAKTGRTYAGEQISQGRFTGGTQNPYAPLSAGTNVATGQKMVTEQKNSNSSAGPGADQAVLDCRVHHQRERLGQDSRQEAPRFPPEQEVQAVERGQLYFRKIVAGGSWRETGEAPCWLPEYTVKVTTLRRGGPKLYPRAAKHHARARPNFHGGMPPVTQESWRRAN